MRAILLAASLCVGLATNSIPAIADPEQSELTPNAKWLISEFETRLADQSEAASEVLRLHAISQYPSILLNDLFNREQMTLEDRDQLIDGVRPYLDQVAAESTTGLERLVGEIGWDGLNALGPYYMEKVFEILILTNDQSFAEAAIPTLEPLARDDFINSYQFALFYDEVKYELGKPQRYGTAFKCVDGAWDFGSFENPDRVDALRAELGMDSLEDFKNGEISIYGSCPE